MSIKRLSYRPFMLLEVLLSMALLTLCGFAAIQPIIKAFSAEGKALERVLFEQWADVSFGEIKQQLFEQRIPWSDLTHKKAGILYALNPVKIQLGTENIKEYQRNFTIYSEQCGRKPSDPIYNLLVITIWITPEGTPPNSDKAAPFVYKCLIQKNLGQSHEKT